MTNDEILKIKEHIEIHARREPHAIKITEIMWRAVDELEHIAELEKENAELNDQVARMLNGAFNIYQNDNDRLRKENTELKDDNRVIADNYSKMEQEFYDNLAKAREIIENIIRVTWGEGWNYSLDWKVKAEQFLNIEVVK